MKALLNSLHRLEWWFFFRWCCGFKIRIIVRADQRPGNALSGCKLTHTPPWKRHLNVAERFEYSHNPESCWSPPWWGRGSTCVWLGCLLVASLSKLFLAHSTGRRPQGSPITHWRYYIFLLAWEQSGIPQEKLESVAGYTDIGVSLLRPRPNLG